MNILVIDIGTSSVRASIVGDDGRVRSTERAATSPLRPHPGAAEFDAQAIASAAADAATALIARSGPIDVIGIASQRASTVVWDRTTGVPVGPGIGWQDLRTVGQCLGLSAKGMRLSPNQSATKVAYLLDRYDPNRSRDLCFGTVECWIAWTMSRGDAHVTDATSAGVTGLCTSDASRWDETVLTELNIPVTMLPKIVDSSGVIGIAHELPGSPPIGALVGDQQASLIGQGCLSPGDAKATFGTGAMLDCCVGERRPAFPVRGEAGTFPIVAWQVDGHRSWGIEAIMLSAGACIDWLRDGLGLLESAAQSDAIAASVPDAGGVQFVPALNGLGTPTWDFGARGTIVGLSASTTRAEIVHAVLEGIAQSAADLVESAEHDGDRTISALHVDGGMSANSTFVGLLASAISRPVLISPEIEATTLGAAFLAGVSVGVWDSLDEAAATVSPRAVIEGTRKLDRERWLDARTRSLRTVPSLSALSF